MPDGVEKESGQARRQRLREERRRRENERRLEGQRRENERKCEALRKKAAAGDAAARAKNENGRGEGGGGAGVDQLGGEEEEPQPQLEEASRSDGQKKRSKPRSRRAATKARRASPTAPPAKNEHPELHVIAQLTPLAPPSPPLTPCDEASLHSGKGEPCHQDEDFRTRMEADYLFDPPGALRCAKELAVSAPSPVEESAQTREAAADVLFFELPRVDDSTVAAIVPIVKIGRASAAFYRNSGESGNTRQPQKLFRGRGRGRGFGSYGRGGRAPMRGSSWTNWG